VTGVRKSFAIDALPERAAHYRGDHALVAVDVFRATTVILTALAHGHDVHPAASITEALLAAARLAHPVLMGEQRGVVPSGFELDNSPAAIEKLEGGRPIVLLTSSGTVLLRNCAGARAVYVACLRNLQATAEHLATQEHSVALLGAGTQGQPRPEDQLACAWIGAYLEDHGFEPETERTIEDLRRYRGADLGQVIEGSVSTDWLRSVHKSHDVDFVLQHVDDLPCVAVFDEERVRLLAHVGSGVQAAERL
jgi:2-phosphosulfolactate phosphatase